MPIVESTKGLHWEWEYLVRYLSPQNPQDRLNFYGSHGWELVCLQCENMYIFKRMKKEVANEHQQKEV